MKEHLQATASTLVTFRARRALHEVAKMLAVPETIITGAVKELESHDAARVNSHSTTLQDYFKRQSYKADLLLALSAQIAVLPRHLGIHNGGGWS